jgi:hypothetical protein
VRVRAIFNRKQEQRWWQDGNQLFEEKNHKFNLDETAELLGGCGWVQVYQRAIVSSDLR